MSFLILQVQVALKDAGFLIQQSPLHSSGWLAYHPSHRVGSESCVHNGRPPQLIVYVTDALVHEIRLRTVEFEVTGQVPSNDPSGIWVRSTVYGFSFESPKDIIDSIPTAMTIGSAVWDAAFRAAQSVL